MCKCVFIYWTMPALMDCVNALHLKYKMARMEWAELALLFRIHWYEMNLQLTELMNKARR